MWATLAFNSIFVDLVWNFVVFQLNLNKVPIRENFLIKISVFIEIYCWKVLEWFIPVVFSSLSYSKSYQELSIKISIKVNIQSRNSIRQLVFSNRVLNKSSLNVIETNVQIFAKKFEWKVDFFPQTKEAKQRLFVYKINIWFTKTFIIVPKIARWVK